MNLSLYLQCSLMFLLGQALDLFLIKIPEYRALYKRANEDFVWKKYWASDWNVIVGTQVFGLICILGIDQIVNWKPFILDYAKWFFAALGGFGSGIIVAKWSSCKKYIMNIIDSKTNIADNKT